MNHVTIGGTWLVILLLCHHSTAAPPGGKVKTVQTQEWQGSGPPVKTARKLLLFLFDAFRWDYADMPGLTGFPRLFKRGVRAEYMRSEYPTNSWPNHYSITTGLHVESHGMVDNVMYDPDTKEVFDFRNENYNKSYWWDGGDPIWITATRQGLRAHMYYWLGCEMEIRGLRPEFWIPYPVDDMGPTAGNFTDDIDEAIEKIKNDTADLIGLYLDLPDYFGHHNGTLSIALNNTVRKVDKIVSHLLDAIDDNNLGNIVDVIITSDHGMHNRSEKKRIFLKDYINEETWNQSIITAAMGTADMGLWPKEGKREFIYKALKNAHPNMTVYYKEDLPEDEYWHFKNHKRTPPIFLKADIGWDMVKPTHKKPFVSGGSHGWDNHEKDMRGSFFAFGPHFMKNYKSRFIPNVDIYQIMCKILDVEPSPHNGTWGHVAPMLIPGNWTKMVRIKDWKLYMKTPHVMSGGLLAFVFILLLLITL